MKRLFLLGLLSLGLSSCVQTSDPRFKPDFAEAARINTQLGHDYLQQGRVDLAQSKFQKALKQDDSLAATHLGMALVHVRYKETEQARSFFLKAEELAPTDPEVLTYFGDFLCRQKAYPEAEAYFEKAIQQGRNSLPEASMSVAGQCYLEQQRVDLAESYLRRALEINPRYPVALFGMAQISYQREDYLRVRAFLQRLQAVQGVNPDILLLALRSEYALGNHDRVTEHAEHLRELVPGIDDRYDLVTGQAW